MFSQGKKRSYLQQASENVTRLLSGRMSGEDETRMHKMRKASAAYQNEFLDTVRMMSDLEGLANDRDIVALLHESPALQSSSQFGAQADPRRWPWAVAALLLVSVFTGYRMWQGELKPDIKADRYVTAVGEQKKVTLRDGTKMTLNTGTQLFVEYSQSLRRVTLERGEVYFDVAPDPQQPFTVDLGQRSVTVLGTAFNIHKSSDTFTLALVEGEVSIHLPDELASTSSPVLHTDSQDLVRLQSAAQRRIRAGTTVEFDNESGELAAYLSPDINKHLRWRTGLLSFKNEPLALVVKELNRYSRKKILIEDSSIMDMEIYATIRLDQISAALEGLENTIPVKVTKSFDSIALSDKRRDTGIRHKK